MKNFILICLIIMVLWLGWKHFFRESEVIFKTETVAVVKTETVVAPERYGSELRKITDTLFSPLTETTPNPISNITRLSGIVASDVAHGHLDQSQARLILDLCAYLERLHAEREKFSAGYRSLKSRNFGSLARRESDRRRDAAQTRKFFIDAHMRKWDEFVMRERPKILNSLEIIYTKERNQAHSN